MNSNLLDVREKVNWKIEFKRCMSFEMINETSGKSRTSRNNMQSPYFVCCSHISSTFQRNTFRQFANKRVLNEYFGKSVLRFHMHQSHGNRINCYETGSVALIERTNENVTDFIEKLKINYSAKKNGFHKKKTPFPEMNWLSH